MEINSPNETSSNFSRDQIVQRLVACGVPRENLALLPLGLVDFVKGDNFRLSNVIRAIVPNEEHVFMAHQEAEKHGLTTELSKIVKDQFRECFAWLMWLMFEDEPRSSLKKLARLNIGQRGVCGSVWGDRDIAYRCRTCEHDRTCAICVTCFQNGNHKDHDYSIMYTSGGCCDCGDATAWKPEGFCSKHKGVEQIQPLPEETAKSMGPVLDILFGFWREKILSIETSKRRDFQDEPDLNALLARFLSLSITEMLLNFCKHSESLLNFISGLMLSSVDLVNVLIKAEQLLPTSIVRKLHELLLKLLGEPAFKYEFAKMFVRYYPDIIHLAISKSDKKIFDHHPLLPMFSVQIFTVPTLCVQLVKDVNLLGTLLGCLGDLFLSCIGEDVHLQVNKCANLLEPVIRVFGDIQFVLSHSEVSRYVFDELPEISQAWMQLLALAQCMDPQIRLHAFHVEEENENVQIPFIMGRYFGFIDALLETGAFSADNARGLKGNISFSSRELNKGNDGSGHADVGKLFRKSTASVLTERSASHSLFLQVPSVLWLISECLMTIDNSLGFDAAFGKIYLENIGNKSAAIITNLMELLSKMSGKSSDVSAFSTSAIFQGDKRLSSDLCIHSKQGKVVACKNDSICSGYGENRNSEDVHTPRLNVFHFLNLEYWPKISLNVSSQEVSFHIPLHRFLSLLLHKTLRRCSEDTGLLEPSSLSCGNQFVETDSKFFERILQGCHPNGFSACIMEHPLRLRVACAQIRAGMWKKNGDPALISLEWYRSVRWSEQGMEFDLFLLQCCAALASPGRYVETIVDRFGLSDYLSLNLERPNEYEPALVQEMLTLIIQIIQERRYCGLTHAENLQRELICKLAVGDATHSQLVKYLPHDLSKSEHLQLTLDKIADYSNPSGFKQGKYSLRSLYWKELDLYHPRWNLRDLQLAEERYMHFCGVSASCAQLPRWRKIYSPLHTIYRFAMCKAVCEVIRAVLFYACFSDNQSLSRAPDGALLTALHLLSLSIDICHLYKQGHANLHNSLYSDKSPARAEYHTFVVHACEKIVDTGTCGSYSHYSWKDQSMLSLLVLLLRRYKQELVMPDVSNPNFVILLEDLLRRISELDAQCSSMLQNLAPDLVRSLSEPSSMDHSLAAQKKAKVRERQAAILEKMKAAQLKFAASIENQTIGELNSSNSVKDDTPFADTAPLLEDLIPLCSLCQDPHSKSSICLLVFLQKSRLATFVEREPPSWTDPIKSGKEQPSSSMDMQVPSVDDFLMSDAGGYAVHVEEFANENSNRRCQGNKLLKFIMSLHSPRDIHHADVPNELEPTSRLESLENNMYVVIQRGIVEMMLKMCASEKTDVSQTFGTVDDFLNDDRDRLVLLNEYAASLPKSREKYVVLFEADDSFQREFRFSQPVDGFGPSVCDGIHVSSCGHMMHKDCYDDYLSSLRQRLGRRTIFERGFIIDPDQGEFLCPVCRRLANSILPVISVLRGVGPRDLLDMESNGLVSAEGSLTSCGDDAQSSFYIHLALSIIHSSANETARSEFSRSHFAQFDEQPSANLQAFFHTLCKMYYPQACETFLSSGRVASSVLVWDALRYTVISAEIAARSRGKSSADSSDTFLRALYKELDLSAFSVLSLLVENSLDGRRQDYTQQLLRFRNVQLLSKSICAGVSADDLSLDSGDISLLLRRAEEGITYPDFQLWKRAADPILAHDPFSSLMWVLFSLPSPFLSSTTAFFSLVHLFYIVCLIQTLITMVLSQHHTLSKLQYCKRLIKQIHETMGNSVASKKYFVSCFINSYDEVNELLRAFTHGYLRRCALLWRLLKSCFSSTWNDKKLLSEQSGIGNAGQLPLGSGEIQLLEREFRIASLDTLLDDEFVHVLALRWCKHFVMAFEDRNYGRVVPIAPAMPFSLMQLPHLYHDLLQRYIKERCSNCNAVLLEPALCLICGKLCSPTWKSCCRKNECPRHAAACGAGIGVFLLVRITTILLLRSSRQAPWPSPYLDAFGEEDLEISRGRPLYLNEERYAALTHMVATHGLDRTSEVLRQTTIDTVFIE